jgi:5-methyltetrahydrofolate--homocysteine methyltransferase
LGGDRGGGPVVVAGDIGPTGQLLAPYGLLEFDEAVNAFCEQAQALLEGGVDVFWIETMSDLEEVRAAVEGCRCVAPGYPLVTTLTFDTNGRTMMGVTPEQALQTLREFDVLALGGNCGNGPSEIEGVIERMHNAHPETVLVAKANAGLPHMEGDRAVYDATPDVMADYARQFFPRQQPEYALGHSHGRVRRIAPGGKSIGLGFIDDVHLGHG